MTLRRTLWWCIGCVVIGAAGLSACASGAHRSSSSSGGDGGNGGDSSTSSMTSASGGGSGVTSVTSVTSAGQGGSSAQSTSAGAGGGGTGDIKYCQVTCAVAADCSLGSPAYDADNYKCVGGACQYKGCNSDAECAQTFNDQNYGCGLTPESSVNSCYPKCSAAADCTVASKLYDLDNYQCYQGLCRWTGCNSNDECAEAYNDPNYVCGPGSGLSYDTCVLKCSSPSDCATATPIYSADNYECNAGRCDWIGCVSADECKQSFMAQNYTCK